MTLGQQLGLVFGACSLTLAGHAAMREFYDRSIEVAVTRIVRAEVAPIRDSVTRAHERIDEMLAARKP